MDEFKKWKWSLSPGLPHDAEAAFRAGMAIGEARGRVLGMEEAERIAGKFKLIDEDSRPITVIADAIRDCINVNDCERDHCGVSLFAKCDGYAPKEVK